jgi:hypothetical protein
VLSHLLRPDGGLNVVGLEDGTIRTLSLLNTTDLGVPIVAHVTTGFLDRGSDQLKLSTAVRLVLKRTAALSNGVVCYLEYRDDLSDEWTTIAVDLGVEDANMTPVIMLRSLGTYRRRQWRFRFADSAALVLVRATETFEILDS